MENGFFDPAQGFIFVSHMIAMNVKYDLFIQHPAQNDEKSIFKNTIKSLSGGNIDGICLHQFMKLQI